MKVELLVPGNPVPRYRGKPMLSKKTGRTFMYFPPSMMQFEDRVRTATIQKQAEILAIIKADLEGRIRLKFFYSFESRRRSDLNNIDSLVLDGIAQGVVWVPDAPKARPNDRNFFSDGHSCQDQTNLEGYTKVEIYPYGI